MGPFLNLSGVEFSECSQWIVVEFALAILKDHEQNICQFAPSCILFVLGEVLDIQNFEFEPDQEADERYELLGLVQLYHRVFWLDRPVDFANLALHLDLAPPFAVILEVPDISLFHTFKLQNFTLWLVWLLLVQALFELV